MKQKFLICHNCGSVHVTVETSPDDKVDFVKCADCNLSYTLANVDLKPNETIEFTLEQYERFLRQGKPLNG